MKKDSRVKNIICYTNYSKQPECIYNVCLLEIGETDMNEKIENKKILIFTGGMIDLVWARKWLETKQFDYVIAADKGLLYADELNCKVDYILGDYDSVNKDLLEKYRGMNVEIITFPCEKDYTDTHLAIETAIEKGASQITILGATGSRMDHTMSNIQNMKMALHTQIPCYIINEFNKIYLADHSVVIKKSEQFGNYVSLIPLSESVTGLTLSGFYYPLKNALMYQGLSVGISNEIVEEEGTIEFDDGILIVFETKD